MDGDSSDPYRFDCNGDATKRVGKVIAIQQWMSKIGLCEVQVMVKKSDIGDDALATADPSTANGHLMSK